MDLKTSAVLSLLGIFLVWPHVGTSSAAPPQQALTGPSSTTSEPRDYPRVEKMMTRKCDSNVDNYCLNNGECMFLVDLNERHCKCEKGYHGPRCAHVGLVSQPMKEEHVIVMVVCVCLLIIGLAGSLYFFCKWYKEGRNNGRKEEEQMPSTEAKRIPDTSTDGLI